MMMLMPVLMMLVLGAAASAFMPVFVYMCHILSLFLFSDGKINASFLQPGCKYPQGAPENALP